MAEVNLNGIISACTGVLSLLTFIVWHVYNKASTTQKEDIKAIHEKIDSNTAHCINKQRDLQMQIDQTRSEVVNHKLEAISRQDANSLFEEKIRPVKESIDKVEKAMEKGMDKMDDKFEIMLKALSRIEGCLDAQKRRRDDE